MRKLHVVIPFLLVFFLTLSSVQAGPGDYKLRIKGGPSFNLEDWENQGRIGGEFDYDFGYSLGFDLLALFGFSDSFRFGLMPNIRYDYVYIGPAALYGVFGIGYGVYKTQSALDMRFGTGLSLPLGDQFEFNTDANIFIAPAGTPGTPVTFDWLLAIGFRFY